MAYNHSLKVYDELRKNIGDTKIITDKGAINITVSIGVCAMLLDSIEEMIKKADSMLYKAKEEGRNMVRHIE